MTEFEKRLKLLFDAQDFYCNPQLNAIIGSEAVKVLSDDELEGLFAAGDLFAAEENKNKDGCGDDKK